MQRRWAQQLWQAEQDLVPCIPPSQQDPSLTLADAYRIQALGWELRGEPIAGWKVALTSLDFQRRMGIDHPLYGALLESQHRSDGGSMEGLMLPRVETEVAFVLGSDLTEISREGVRRATSHLCVAFDVCDSRMQGAPSAIDLVADNAGAGCFVLGPEKVAVVSQWEKASEKQAWPVTVWRNGELEFRGGQDGPDPLDAVVWLAAELNLRGLRLRAGQVILSGALAPQTAANWGDLVEAEVQGLGRLSARFPH